MKWNPYLVNEIRNIESCINGWERCEVCGWLDEIPKRIDEANILPSEWCRCDE